MQPFDNAVGLRPPHPFSEMVDALEPQEQLVGVMVGWPQNSRPLSDSTVSILASWASKVDGMSLFLRCTAETANLARIQPGLGCNNCGGDRGLQIDLPDALERAEEEGVDGDQGAGEPDLDVALIARPMQNAD